MIFPEGTKVKKNYTCVCKKVSKYARVSSMKKNQKGRIRRSYRADPSDVEIGVAKILAELGGDVIFIPEETIPRPDIIYRGMEWEIKSPRGKAARTIEDALRRALKQSSNVVLDLRFIKRNERQCFNEVAKQCKEDGIKNVLIITKDEKVVDKFCKFDIMRM